MRAARLKQERQQRQHFAVMVAEGTAKLMRLAGPLPQTRRLFVPGFQFVIVQINAEAEPDWLPCLHIGVHCIDEVPGRYSGTVSISRWLRLHVNDVVYLQPEALRPGMPIVGDNVPDDRSAIVRASFHMDSREDVPSSFIDLFA